MRFRFHQRMYIFFENTLKQRVLFLSCSCPRREKMHLLFKSSISNWFQINLNTFWSSNFQTNRILHKYVKQISTGWFHSAVCLRTDCFTSMPSFHCWRLFEIENLNEFFLEMWRLYRNSHWSSISITTFSSTTNCFVHPPRALHSMLTEFGGQKCLLFVF